MRSNIETTKVQTGLRILLGVMLAFAGTSHLTFARAEFLAQVPDWVPIDQDLTVLLSGIVEILLGACLIFMGRYKVYVGIIVALFFIAVFPGNIHQYTDHVSGFGLDTDTKRLVRLFFQPVLVAWALWACGVFRAWSTSHVKA